MEKTDETQSTFACSNMDLANDNPSCYFSNKPADCLFEEQNKTIADISHVVDESNLNAPDCGSSLYNMRKKGEREVYYSNQGCPQCSGIGILLFYCLLCISSE